MKTNALFNFIRSKLRLLMHIAIKRTSTLRKDDHLIILADSDKNIPESIFSREELAFLKKELKADKKQIAINQYNRMILIQMVDIGEKPQYQLLEIARKCGSTISSRINGLKIEKVTVTSSTNEELTLAVLEGMLLSNYQFLKYRTNASKEAFSLKTIQLHSTIVSNKELQYIESVCAATYQARTLVNEPQSFLNAREMAKQFARMGKEAGFKVEILNKAKITQLKMGGLLAVNLGSIEPPTFTIMEYKPAGAKNKKPYVLVGKGVVYDTGGMSLKPTPNSMDFMKCDMGGGATVAGAMYAIAKAKLPVHVIGLVPATDNRPDGNAYVPGDVITMMSGKTVEVLNTDAEGRLILSDALHYAKRYKPELVLEFATLTGAASAAIGQYGIVAMGKVDEITRAELHKAGENVYERLAEFPFWDEYDELIKSDVADIKNVGGPSGGAITAGKFLAQFTDYPFMHFDIAGPAYVKSMDSYRGKYGTGVGVRLLFEFFKQKSK
jgi:leucyl aminopeptidase